MSIKIGEQDKSCKGSRGTKFLKMMNLERMPEGRYFMALLKIAEKLESDI
jgi:hypothetical protein